MTEPVDSSILHEIVRIIDSRRKVPDRVIVTSKEYLLTYLEDHRNRLEEALMRFDGDRLNMLYGQLASKVKYQLLRRVPARAAAAMGLTAAKPTRPAANAAARAAKPAAKKVGSAKPKKVAAAKPKKAAAKPKAKKAAAKPKAKKAVARPRKAAPAKNGRTARAKTAKKPAAAKKTKVATRRAAARPKKKTRR